MLRTRIITALIAFPVAVVSVQTGGILFLMAVALVALIAGWEFGRMMRAGGYKTTPVITLGFIGLLLLEAYRSYLNLSCIISAVLLTSIVWQLFKGDSKAPTADWALTLAGGLYIGWGAAQLIAMRQLSEGMAWVWLALLATWGADIFAYLVGRALGRRKLWPRLSPKKTWEGLFGGVFGSMLGAGIVIYLFHLDWVDALIVGSIVPFVSLFGDLSISMMKRHVGVKDSSNLFPGHGGFLDRLDSMLFVSIVVYNYAVWIAFLTP